jgi:rod shape-determining protein MreD
MLNAKNTNSKAYLPIILSFLFAFCFMIMPIPSSIKWLRPDLVTLVLIYWTANLPMRVGVIFAFIVGLMFDLLTGMLFGSMGLTLAVVAFLTMSLRLRIRAYRYWQKFIMIMLLVGCSQLIRLWIQIVIGHPPANVSYWLCSVTSALTWPLVESILSSYQRSLRLTT